MKKNGFTLVELLGVIIILSLLLLIVLPRIVNSVKGSSNKTDKLIEEMIFDAADLYISNHSSSFTKSKGIQYEINLQDLVDDGSLSSPIKLPDGVDITGKKCIQVTYNNKFQYELKDIGKCEKNVLVEAPDLYNNTLTPVVYNGSNWVVADTTKEWYNYAKQEWANAVILNEEVRGTKDVGDIVTVEGDSPDALAMFVWIPRYEYKYTNLGTKYAGGTQEQPGGIDINFISKETTVASKGYIIHPAFTFGDTTLSGLWVGKFETSHTTLSTNDYPVISSNENKLGCNSADCTNSDGLRILPNKTSLRHNNVSNFFFASRSMTREGNPFGLDSSFIDSHMIKNRDWGAVSYLSQSIFGKYGNDDYEGENKEIYLNNSFYMTGKSSGEPNPYCHQNSDGIIVSQEEDKSCTNFNIYDYKDQNGGVGASTTGNIYGIYDMNGGALERVMGFYSKAVDGLDLSGGNSNLNNIDKKYYDKYSDIDTVACNGKECYGHATTETKYWYGSIRNYAFPNDEYRFIRRGGKYDNEYEDNGDYRNSSIFYLVNGEGKAVYARTFRIVLTNP